MSKGAFRRWMYRGHHPNWLGRILNREAAVLGSLGLFSRYGLATLEVTGRTSGRTVSLPVAGRRSAAAYARQSNSKRCPLRSVRPS
jgi:hypothetical protein